jgi:hypothetical protein
MGELYLRAERENEAAAYWLLYCHDENNPDWIKLVEHVDAGLSVRDQIILRLRRKHKHRRGPYGWTEPAAKEYAEEVARLTGQTVAEVGTRHRNTLASWWNRIITYTVREAIRQKLL